MSEPQTTKIYQVEQGNFKKADTPPPKPMVEIETIETLAHNAGRKGGEEYLRDIWSNVLFWVGSLSGYLFGIISVFKEIVR